MSEQNGANQETIPNKLIVVDKERVSEVLGRLVCAFENREFPYSLDSTRVPQDHRHMPKTLEFGTREHAMFLWTICYYMRGGIKSNIAVTQMAAIYDQHPELFIAEVAKDIPPEDIATILTENGLGFQKTVSNAWTENARRLFEQYEGDPRKIFDGVSTYEGSLTRVKNDMKGNGFIGFQEKMVSMIIYYLADEGLISPFEFPLPVDIHVLRVSVANELVKFYGYEDDENIFSDELLAIMRGLFLDYAREHQLDMLRLCDAVWLLSQSTCGLQPGNITLEPNGRENRNGRKTHLVPGPVDVNDETQRQQYMDTCARCPIESTCTWNVPGKIYYVQGELKRRGRRIRFPKPSQGQLF